MVIDSAYQATFPVEKATPSTLEEMLRVWPAWLVRTILESGIAIASSVMLFTLALAESRGEELSLEMAFTPFTKPLPLLLAAMTGGLVSFLPTMAVIYFVNDWSYALVLWIVWFLASPFYLFVLPRILDRGVPVGVAVRDNLAAGFKHYPSLLGTVLTAFFTSFWGVFICCIGYIWTQPNYQRVIVSKYREIFEDGSPTGEPPLPQA